MGEYEFVEQWALMDLEGVGLVVLSGFWLL